MKIRIEDIEAGVISIFAENVSESRLLESIEHEFDKFGEEQILFGGRNYEEGVELSKDKMSLDIWIDGTIRRAEVLSRRTTRPSDNPGHPLDESGQNGQDKSND